MRKAERALFLYVKSFTMLLYEGSFKKCPVMYVAIFKKNFS